MRYLNLFFFFFFNVVDPTTYKKIEEQDYPETFKKLLMLILDSQ